MKKTNKYLVQVQKHLMDRGAVTDSRIVAKLFDKRHDNVLRAIQNLECSDEFAQLNFEQCSYKDVNNQSRSMIKIKRDGLMFLVMGFTGRHAAQFKEYFIKAFNTMRAYIVTQEGGRVRDNKYTRLAYKVLGFEQSNDSKNGRNTLQSTDIIKLKAIENIITFMLDSGKTYVEIERNLALIVG